MKVLDGGVGVDDGTEMELMIVLELYFFIIIICTGGRCV